MKLQYFTPENIFWGFGSDGAREVRAEEASACFQRHIKETLRAPALIVPAESSRQVPAMNHLRPSGRGELRQRECFLRATDDSGAGNANDLYGP